MRQLTQRKWSILKTGVRDANFAHNFSSGTLFLQWSWLFWHWYGHSWEANFALYCEALSELIPYFFANNNINYARWLPIHLRDMMSLEQHHPQVAREFHNGNFVVHKSCREFSAIAIDQAHEQANAVIKGDGGAIGVTEDPSALRSCWPWSESSGCRVQGSIRCQRRNKKYQPSRAK